MDLVGASVFVVQEVKYEIPPAAGFRLTPQAPFAYVPVYASGPAAGFRLVPQAPEVMGSAYVDVLPAGLRLTPQVPTVTVSTPSFDPLTLSPVAWWDASDASTITTSGGMITDWEDKSGNNWHLSQATASQRPAYTTAAINGLNAAVWPSTDNDDFLQSGAGTFAFREFYAVARFANTQFTGYQGLFDSANSGVDGWCVGDALTTGLYLPLVAVYLNGDNTTDRSSNLWPELGSVCLLRCLASSDLSTSSGVVLGTDNLFITPNRSWLGEICEFLPFSGALTSGDRTDLEDYLMTKWGIT
jgi:hypothetical protein